MESEGGLTRRSCKSRKRLRGREYLRQSRGAVEAGGGVCGQVAALEGGDDGEEGEDTDVPGGC